MIRKILLVIVLVFLITGIGFAFQNEPDGFRGLKWGDEPTEDMTFLDKWIVDKNILTKNLLNQIFIQVTYSQNLYYRENEKLNIGSAKLDNIFYNFNIYSNQFYRVSSIFSGEANYNILKMIFEEKYGKPTDYSSKAIYGYLLQWTGDKAEIKLYYNSEKSDDWYHKGWFSIESINIHPESPEDNKQKELEKAKEDF